MDDFIEKLLYRTDIVDLIGKDIKLTQKGATFWGLCPFHGEKTPSFAVNRDRQFYHCFGCGESGNAITYVAKTNSITNYEAVKILAENAGLEVPKSGYGAKTLDSEVKARYLRLLVDLARHYRENLYSPKGKVMLDYILGRGFTHEIIKKFGLGASIDFNDAIDYLRAKGYSDADMKTVGVAAVNKNGGLYDVFNHRLMFPIINHLGEVVAFGGRTLEKNPEAAKYRNSSQTPVFDKSDVLFGANYLKKRRSLGPIEYLIITEGYMDVMALHQGGFDTAVASMGTALTERQARRLKGYANLVYVSYDGDKAGKLATVRGLDILKNAGLTVRVVSLPEGLDPDDVIKRDGAEGYKALLKASKPLTQFKIENLAATYDVNDPDGRAKMAVEGAKIIKSLPTLIEQEQYLPLLSSMTGFTADVLRSQADMLPETAEEKPIARSKPMRVKNSGGAVEFILAARLSHPEFCNYDDNLYEYMPDDFSRKVYEFTEGVRENALTGKVFELGLDEAQLNSLFGYEFIPGDGVEKYNDCASELRIVALGKRFELLMKDFDLTKDRDLLTRAQAIGRRVEELKRQRRKL